MGVDLRGLKIRRLMVTGEPLTPAAKGRIEECWGTEVYNFFGMAEIGVAAVECWLHHSLHFLHDYLYPEILDPKTHSTLKTGEVGELVVTTLSKFGMPFIRYNTRDLVSMSDEACPCGFSGTSITKHLGRSDGMIKVKGKGVYPAYVEQVLLSTPELGSEYQIIVKHGTYGDNIMVQAEVQRGRQADEELKKRIAYKMREELGVNLEIEVSDYGKLSREGGWKAKRIVESDVR
jgi:phenylacetate-CoA ligase